MLLRIILLLICCSILSLQQIRAQELILDDSTVVKIADLDSAGILEEEIDSVYVEGLEENRPMKATFYAAILPGLGQIYNKKYWKLPVLYGAFGTIGYYLWYNNRKYQQYRSALLEKRSYPESLWESVHAINISEDNLQRGADYYRRNRDLLMIIMAGVYFLQIVDAHVDAHLMEFDISEDLGMRVEPGIGTVDGFATMSYGLKLKIHFNSP